MRGWGRLLKAGLACILVFALFQLARDWKTRQSAVTLALVPEEVAAAASRSGYPEDDVWERARTIGASAVVAAPQPLGVLIDRGEIVHFSRAEAEKWAAAGLVAPGTPLKANTLWSRRRDVLLQAVGAARSWGTTVSTQTFAGMLIAQLPADADPRTLPAGLDAGVRRVLGAFGLSVVVRCLSTEDLARAWALPDVLKGAVFLLDFAPPPSRHEGEDLRDLLLATARSAPRAQLGLRGQGASLWAAYAPQLSGAVGVSEAVLEDGTQALWRAVSGDGARVLIVRMDSQAGAEANLIRLRRWAQELQAAGRELGAPQASGADSEPLAFRLRHAIALLLAALAPLWAMRWGLETVRRSAAERGRRGGEPWWAAASPIPELAAGLAVLLWASEAAGLAAHALLGAPQWRLGVLRGFWTPWVYAAPLLLSAGALFPEALAPPAEWAVRLRRPLTGLDGLRAAAALGLLVLLTAPHVLGPAATAAGGLLPWWVLRFWRLAIIGVPSLTVGLWLHLRRLDLDHGKTPRAPDPRPWLLAGLLGPVGTIHELGLARAPFETAAALAAAAWGLGAGLAVLALAVLSLREKD